MSERREAEPKVLLHSTEPSRPGSAARVHLTAIADGLAREGFQVGRNWADPAHSIARRLVSNTLDLRRKLADADVLYLRWHVVDVIPLWIARRRGVPYVLEVNGPVDDIINAHPVLRSFRPVLSRVARRQFKGASRIVTVSRGLAEWVGEQGGDHARPETVQNGADQGSQVLCRPADDPPYVVYFGRLDERQGLRFLLEARRSAEWPAHVGLVIIGDGDLRPEVVAAEEAGLLTYHPSMAQDQTHAIVAAACASVSVQSPDFPRNNLMGLPFKTVESLMLGVPVIGTDLSDQGEVLEQFPPSAVVEYGDIARFTALVSELAGTSTAAREELARKAAGSMTWERAARQTAAVVRDALRA
ncbi:MAG: glycosyltransferase [Actinomycetia bacterium]|nr:glycosyltransferase [Actinomycetes bacterium]